MLRSFAWSIILAYQGPLNAALHGLGLIDKPIRWRTGFNGVIIGLVYTYVLFMVFPIYNAIQSLDSNQIEAAQDLGAPLWRIHWRVVIPHAKPGIGSGCIMVFMLSAGSILVPSILGSTDLALVHRDHPAMVLRGRRLEHRRGLRLPAARPVHGLRQPDDAVAERSPCRHREMRGRP